MSINVKRSVIVSAGDAITAKLVEEAGFDGIWVSGFEASARLGLADNGSITMTEMLNITKPIVDAVAIPVWVDVDTGYGNFKRTVREFEAIGVTGVCVEDNIPEFKINSLWGDKIPLYDKIAFGKKIEQCNDRDIKIIARTEALIRGYGEEEAYERLKHYAACGADILLPHARDRKSIFVPKIYEMPLAIVPTKFPYYKNKNLFDMGFSMVIWANQTERIKIKATREALIKFKLDDSMLAIEQDFSATLEDMKNLMPE